MRPSPSSTAGTSLPVTVLNKLDLVDNERATE